MASVRMFCSRGPSISRQFLNIARPIATCSRCYVQDNTVTHTGQVFDKSDYRQVRYSQAQKEVNQKFAINLIDDVPPKVIAGRHVYCDGGGGALGHPKVYINLDPPGAHSCGYCGLRFTKKAH
ncbi:NADH dehydrogenase [ubiquinone] iron-sulfur protein 6, mitochondrial-like [Saccoglossus kowalevskii]|uniref:NADH dehydrogenase [ubiquinone] iron-sulfur protein 6, mitochondrial-like n=1 Tax=Saccoglossus kowalevskii TaxID=10224 RepID=A0ABM0GQ53_SACKO|nr:PREDICTED: NADH dehydrogenase [ubiquinone] iron-sulfur protein 6, mitochondrial-like [Saccoglossus kowalevskii]